MTQAIASDIHGNIERLEQFARVVDSLGIPPQEVYILGDIIHNGADLKENRCVDLIRTQGYQAVSGNHDELQVTIDQLLREEGKPSNLVENFTPENSDFLKSLSPEISTNGFIFRHTIPNDNNKYPYIVIDIDAINGIYHLTQRDKQVAFIGHTHRPVTFIGTPKDGDIVEDKSQSLNLNPNNRYLINPGSLGYHGDYLLYDEDSQTIERKKEK